MATRADTIRAGGVPQAPAWAIRLMILMAFVFAVGVAAVAAMSFAPDRAVDEPGMIRPDRPSDLDDRRPQGTGRSPSKADGVRDPVHLPKR
jgi:hypothetical protein